MSNRDNRPILPPNLELAGLRAQINDHHQILKDFALTIIRLLELQLHVAHMVARQRLFECPMCMREAEAAREAAREKASG